MAPGTWPFSWAVVSTSTSTTLTFGSARCAATQAVSTSTSGWAYPARLTSVALVAMAFLSSLVVDYADRFTQESGLLLYGVARPAVKPKRRSSRTRRPPPGRYGNEQRMSQAWQTPVVPDPPPPPMPVPPARPSRAGLLIVPLVLVLVLAVLGGG